MLESTAPTTLVALGRLAPTLTPTQDRTSPAAILLATIAVGTQQHLVAATRANRRAVRSMSILGDKPKVLDGFVPGCNTPAAPPLSARCRVRRGLPKLPRVGDRCRTRLLRQRPRCTAQCLRVSRASCAAAPLRAGVAIRCHHQVLVIGTTIAAWMAALGRPSRRAPQACSLGADKPSLGISPNSKTLPRRHIEAVLNQRSQLIESSVTHDITTA